MRGFFEVFAVEWGSPGLEIGPGSKMVAGHRASASSILKYWGSRSRKTSAEATDGRSLTTSATKPTQRARLPNRFT